MAQTVEQIMTTNPRTVNMDDTAKDAAAVMRDSDIGDVIVIEDGQVTGILTDRDIVVRAVAEGRDADSTSVADICTTGIQAIEPDASVDDALRTARSRIRSRSWMSCSRIRAPAAAGSPARIARTSDRCSSCADTTPGSYASIRMTRSSSSMSPPTSTSSRRLPEMRATSR